MSALEVLICAVVLICEADLAYCTEYFILQAKKSEAWKTLLNAICSAGLLGVLAALLLFALTPYDMIARIILICSSVVYLVSRITWAGMKICKFIKGSKGDMNYEN